MKAEQVKQEIVKDFETAEEWMLNYPARKSQYFKDLSYIQTEGGRCEVPTSSSISNIVEYKVVSMAELDETEKWLIAVELAQDILGPKKRLFLDLRRKAANQKKTVNGREVWRSYVQAKYAAVMAKAYGTAPEKFWLAERTITEWWKEIVEKMMIIAYKKGCFKNF